MAESKSAVTAALLGNGALAVLKGVAAAVTGSAAMLAETLHSVADTGNQALLFLGMRLGRRPPDRTHAFGYGKDVYFWAFVVARVDLRTMHIGPHDLLVVLGVDFREGLGVSGVEAAIARLQSALNKAFEHTTRPSLIVVEPARSGEAALGQTA